MDPAYCQTWGRDLCHCSRLERLPPQHEDSRMAPGFNGRKNFAWAKSSRHFRKLPEVPCQCKSRLFSWDYTSAVCIRVFVLLVIIIRECYILPMVMSYRYKCQSSCLSMLCNVLIRISSPHAGDWSVARRVRPRFVAVHRSCARDVGRPPSPSGAVDHADLHVSAVSFLKYCVGRMQVHPEGDEVELEHKRDHPLDDGARIVEMV